MGIRAAASAGLVLGVSALVAGCGGGGVTVTGTSTGGSSTGSGGASVEWRTAAVMVDLDADGRADLAAIARDGSGRARCWRGTADGPVPVPPGWAGAEALAAVVDDADAQDDATLADGAGVHRLARAGRAALAYAVLHVGDAADDPSVAPVLDAVEPTSGAVRDVVLLEGHGLAARGVTTTVTFGGLPAQVVLALADAVVAVVPDGLAEGATEVRVQRGTLASGPLAFDVRAREVPVVRSIAPTRVAIGGVLVLHGDHLGTPADRVEVTFAGAPAARAIGLGRVAAVVVPDGAVSGPALLAVEGVASAPFDVAIGAVPAPTITALVPARASVGSLVRLEGTDLFVPGDRLAVTFGGVRAVPFGVGEGAVTVIVPVGAVDGDVVATVGPRTGVGVPFVVAPRGDPAITALEPADVAVGDRLTIRGTDLVDLSAWRIGRLPPLPLLGDLRVVVGGRDAWFLFPTPDGLVVRVPPGAVSGDVVVRVNGVASAPASVVVH